MSLSPTPTSPSPAIIIHRTRSYPAVSSAKSGTGPILSSRISPSSPGVQSASNQFKYQRLPTSDPPSPPVPHAPPPSVQSPPYHTPSTGTAFPLPPSTAGPVLSGQHSLDMTPPCGVVAPPTGVVAQPAVSAVLGVSHLLSPLQGLYGVGCSFPVPEDAVAPSSPNVTPTKMSTSPAKIAVPLGRRSSESDIGTPPKGKDTYTLK